MQLFIQVKKVVLSLIKAKNPLFLTGSEYGTKKILSRICDPLTQVGRIYGKRRYGYVRGYEYINYTVVVARGGVRGK